MSSGDAGAGGQAEAGRPRTVLRAEGLKKDFAIGAARLDVLRGIDLSVRSNEILAIAGPSGAGKSTLLHILGLLEEPASGRVYLNDVDAYALPQAARADARNRSIGFVFQFYHLLKDLDALENTALPQMVRDSWWGYDKKGARARAEALLRRVGLGARMHHRPMQLSGGERQRVAIARALMNEPELVLCDEPTGNLDTRTAAGILELIWELKEETKKTFVIVTHDESLAARADRAVRVVDGRVVGHDARPHAG